MSSLGASRRPPEPQPGRSPEPRSGRPSEPRPGRPPKAEQDHLPLEPDRPQFNVVLPNFTGPFDLLLQLITRRKLDVTEVALSQVTDEFIAHVRLGQAGDDEHPPWDLDQTTAFLVVAATLLDLKAARLLPSGEVEDPEDLAVLEARDLLFARLLQYRAFKVVSAQFAQTLAREGRRHARPGGLEEHFRRLLPEVELRISPEQFAWLAAKALAPKVTPEVSLDHLHAPQVSVAEQAEIMVARLREAGTLTFRTLIEDAGERLVVVARFLSLLELARRQAIAFEQLTPLGELTIRWTGHDASDLTVDDEFDGPQPAKATEPDAPGPSGAADASPAHQPPLPGGSDA